jgi:hypothetical protein
MVYTHLMGPEGQILGLPRRPILRLHAQDNSYILSLRRTGQAKFPEILHIFLPSGHKTSGFPPKTKAAHPSDT